MRVSVGRGLRAAVAIGGVFVLTGCGLTGCGGGSDATGFNQTIRGENGSESSVKFGPSAKIPKTFPSGVPLPHAGALRSVVAEKNPPNASYTMTYALGGRDGIDVGDQYRSALDKAGFSIKHYSSIGGSDGGMVQYDAVGKHWDVAVVSGKASPRDRATLSVQVHTHGQVTSGISGIGDTSPSTDGSGSTATTSP